MPVDTSSLVRQKLFLWAALLLILAASAFSFYATNRLIALSERAERSQAILTDLNRFISDLQGIETGARGFAISGNENFLAPHKAGVADVDHTLARLRDLANGDRRLHGELDRMAVLSRHRVALSRELIARRAAGGESGSLVPDLERGKSSMDQIRRDVGATFAQQQATQRAQELNVERLAWLANIAMALAVLLSIAAVAWLFSISGREVARRRQVEEELKDLNAELEERVAARTGELARSRELLDAVIENMPDPLVLKDASNGFRYVLVNAAAQKLMGMERAELVGHADHEVFPPDQAAKFLEEDQEVAVSGNSILTAARPMATMSGVRQVEVRKVPISGSNGGHRFVLSLVRDLTAQKELEDQLRLSQRMDAVGRLTGGIAHDFNNILAIILGNVDLLREQLVDGSEPAEMAEEALGAAQHGAELVRRLLAFARMQHLEPTALDLNLRLPAIAALLKRALGEAIQLKVKPTEGLWPAMVDPTQVDDALVNLAINARDAMPDGGSLTIETGNIVLDEDYASHHVEVVPGDYVMLAVSDRGAGMSSAVIARAFEPFFTTKGEGLGTGLGLSQVYGWIKQSGGHIKIYSELGHGTTIKLYLPRADAPEQEAAAPLDEGAAAPRGSETILVVEDNPKVRATVLRQLADLGYETLEAEDGEAALDVVRGTAAFDMLLTDVVMPGGMTGYELADAARGVRPGLRILFTSGYTELAATSGQAGLTGPLLSKPYRKRDLGRAVRAVLDNGD